MILLMPAQQDNRTMFVKLNQDIPNSEGGKHAEMDKPSDLTTQRF